MKKKTKKMVGKGEKTGYAPDAKTKVPSGGKKTKKAR